MPLHAHLWNLVPCRKQDRLQPVLQLSCKLQGEQDCLLADAIGLRSAFAVKVAEEADEVLSSDGRGALKGALQLP